MNSKYTFEDGITVNASDAQRADEKHDKVIKGIMEIIEKEFGEVKDGRFDYKKRMARPYC